MATEEQIKELAHTIWEQEGRPAGGDVEHYFRAKQIIDEQEAVQAKVSKMAPSPITELASPPASKRTSFVRRKKR